MYIIDGHNLIPCLPGGSLGEIDDEEMLIGQLQAFSRSKRKSVDVFFDKAPPGRAGERRYGMVRAHFVAERLKADDAILRCLRELGRGARNAVVVTSDRQVQANARALGASVVASDSFAGELGAALTAAAVHGAGQARQGARPHAAEPGVKPGELGEWYDLFGIDPAQAEKPITPARAPKKQAQRPSRRRWHKD